MAAAPGSPPSRAPRALPPGQRATCRGQETRAAAQTGPAAGGPRMARSGGSRAQLRAVCPGPRGHCDRRSRPTDLRPAASAGPSPRRGLPASPPRALGPGPPVPPATRASSPGLAPGGVGVMRFPEDRATPLPAARGGGGRRVGPCRAVRPAGRRGPLPGLGRAGLRAWSGGVWGRAGTVPVFPAPGHPGPRPPQGSPGRRRRRWGPGGALCSATVPAPPAGPSWGSLCTRDGRDMVVRISVREEAVGLGVLEWGVVWGCRAPLTSQPGLGLSRPLPPSFQKPPL